MKILVADTYTLVCGHLCFGGTQCLHLLGWKLDAEERETYAPAKH
jgi:hypothetical protein